MSLKSVLEQIPYRFLLRIKQSIRQRFPVDWPETHPVVEVEVPDDMGFDEAVDLMEKHLRKLHNMEGAPYSYKYKGEVLNLRRPSGFTNSGVPQEVHLRARESDDGNIEVIAHSEANRYEEPKRHVQEKDFLVWTKVKMRRTFGLEGWGIQNHDTAGVYS